VVKKTSLLDKLVGRFRTSGVEIHELDQPGAATNRVASRRIDLPDPEPEVAEVLAKPLAEPTTSRKLSVKEEALITMDGGLKELASLMRGVQVRMDSEGAQMAELANEMRTLPALGQAQLEVLRALAQQLERQNQSGERLLASVAGLPEAMTGLRATLDKVVATDERTAHTLAEFRDTMNTIQGSMREMVGHSKANVDQTERLVRSQDDRAERMAESMAQMARNDRERADKLAQSLEQATAGQREHADRLARTVENAIGAAVQGATRDVDEVKKVAKGLQQTQHDSVAALRMAHEDQATRMSRLVEDGQRSNRGVMALLAVLILAVLGVGAILLLK
jgi:chromosome segregation ATPase